MPFVYNEINQNSNGGTELVTRGLERRLIEQGHQDLVDFFDIYPGRVRETNSGRPSIYTIHDLPGDPEADVLANDGYKKFAACVFVSDWQYNQFMIHYKMSGENCIVINNAIEPIEQSTTSQWETEGLGTKNNPIRLIYHTTPHRGLQLLVPVFDALWKKYQARGVHIVLDVFSSFSIYGWAQRDEAYEPLFEQCRNHPAIFYNGAVPNDEVREALTTSHIFAYPSIWQETSCIAAIEAMSAGCLIVNSNLAALPETTGNLTFSYPVQSTLEGNANRFFGTLDNTIEIILNNPEQVKVVTYLAAARANALFNWKTIIPQWVSALTFLKTQVAS